MTEGQIDALQIVLKSDVIKSALRQAFNDTLYEALPSVGPIEDDEVVGQKYRAYHTSKELIAEAFRTLESYQHTETTHDLPNRAR